MSKIGTITDAKSSLIVQEI